ncbi:DUF7853 family protein [Haladaptatus sp. NG-SE-30]
MPPVTHDAPTAELYLTREEQWVVHVALLQYIEAAALPETKLPEPDVEFLLLERVEAGEFVFTDFELDRLRYELDYYARDSLTPDQDRPLTHRIIEKIDRIHPTKS